jgi:phosphoribosylpyrophosphate synthetase
MKLFLTPSAQHLRRSFKALGFDLGHIETYDFADGEHGYRLKDEVEGKSIGVCP